jgi:ABC-type nitrate/sulfonate/bicarbonate transport system ATPase subunit
VAEHGGLADGLRGRAPGSVAADVGPTATSSRVKVRVQGVSKGFATKGGAVLPVLDELTLEVRAGETVCFVGPSGCGKSTLLFLIAGFARPDAGRILIDAQEVDGPSPKRIFVFQEYGIFPWFTVWDNIGFGIRGVPFEQKHRIVTRYIEMLGLTGFERAYPHELSGGMKQRVAVGRALAVDPDVVFMDEPFGALDSLTRLRMRAELVQIQERERKTILFVTHDVDEAVQIADRVFVFGPRPARLRETIEVPILHPRDPESEPMIDLKRRVLAALGVSDRV